MPYTFAKEMNAARDLMDEAMEPFLTDLTLLKALKADIKLRYLSVKYFIKYMTTPGTKPSDGPANILKARRRAWIEVDPEAYILMLTDAYKSFAQMLSTDPKID